ncbi:hypothetical protein B0H14DRAFT_2625639 [Mycena olivaceomarginata]|nr:hypothetical protein B0H14DRAFT_2625639 [Mycena olivaceomarginata]
MSMRHAVTIVLSTEGAKQLGVAAQQFIETTLFSSVIEELADCWNVHWSRRCSKHRTPEHFMLNIHKGIPVQRDSGLGTLGEFYDVHNKLPQTLRTKSFALPSNMKLAGLYLYLEALVLILERQLAVRSWTSFSRQRTKKKRKKELEYEEGNTQKHGLFKDQLYAFKHFKDVGLGKDIVLLDQNRTELILEVQWLVQLGWFYAKFERRAKSGKVQIKVLRVTECLLAFKLTPQKVDLSVVSMEPFCPGPSQKWSRTNQHPSHPKSLVASTANVFVHFVYATSFGAITVADYPKVCGFDFLLGTAGLGIMAPVVSQLSDRSTNVFPAATSSILGI